MEPQHPRWRAPSRRRQRGASRRIVAAVGVLLLVLTAGPARAVASQDPGDQRAEVRRQRAEKAAQLNTLKAKQGQIVQALDALDANLAAQQTAATRAAEAEQQATAEAAAARQAEQAKQAQISTLEADARNVALNLYMGRSTSGLGALMPAGDVMSAMTTAALTEIAVGGARSSIDALDAARQDLTTARTVAERAQAKAAKQRTTARQQAAQLGNAISLSQKTQAQLDDRIDQNLSEAASLATLDDALSKQIAAQEAAIAERLRKSQAEAAARAAANPGLGGSSRTLSAGRPAILPAAGNLVTVDGITVDASIADALAALIRAAASSGFSLGGNGYRSADQQIAVRRNNCGPSQYDIWQMPASQCHPPAARPGTSMHERGLAIDFTCNGALISSYGSACYGWMRANAPSFGFHNRPGEAWHWSTNGN
jgi:LAS superfamily LD-carboxypeptidase LdcB